MTREELLELIELVNEQANLIEKQKNVIMELESQCEDLGNELRDIKMIMQSMTENDEND